MLLSCLSPVGIFHGQSSMCVCACVRAHFFPFYHLPMIPPSPPPPPVFGLFILAEVGPLLFITVYLLPFVNTEWYFFVNLFLIYMHLHYRHLVVFFCVVGSWTESVIFCKKKFVCFKYCWIYIYIKYYICYINISHNIQLPRKVA